MSASVIQVSFNAAEAAYLGALLGAGSLLGIPDPFYGWLAEEVEPALALARTALAERGLIQVQPGGAVAVDPGVAELIRTCGFPEASFILTHTPAGAETRVRHYHVTRRLAVELVSHPNTPTSDLIRLPDGSAVYHRVLGLFQFEAEAAPALPAARLRAADLQQARTVAAEIGAEAARAELRQAGLVPETAGALAAALASPAASGALVALIRRDTAREADGAAFLAGGGALWHLRSFTHGGEQRVELAPCTAAAARAEIRRVMNRALPVPLPAP